MLQRQAQAVERERIRRRRPSSVPSSKGFARRSTREWRAPTLRRRGEVQLDRLAAGAPAWLDCDLSGTGLEDQRRGLLGAVDADPGAEHPAARAVATRLVSCQSEALARHASTLAAARRARIATKSANWPRSAPKRLKASGTRRGARSCHRRRPRRSRTPSKLNSTRLFGSFQSRVPDD
jgi:hypothetical protein